MQHNSEQIMENTQYQNVNSTRPRLHCQLGTEVTFEISDFDRRAKKKEFWIPPDSSGASNYHRDVAAGDEDVEEVCHLGDPETFRESIIISGHYSHYGAHPTNQQHIYVLSRAPRVDKKIPIKEQMHDYTSHLQGSQPTDSSNFNNTQSNLDLELPKSCDVNFDDSMSVRTVATQDRVNNGASNIILHNLYGVHDEHKGRLDASNIHGAETIDTSKMVHKSVVYCKYPESDVICHDIFSSEKESFDGFKNIQASSVMDLDQCIQGTDKKLVVIDDIQGTKCLEIKHSIQGSEDKVFARTQVYQDNVQGSNNELATMKNCIQGPNHGLVTANSCIQGLNHGLITVNDCIQDQNHELVNMNSCIQGPNHGLVSVNSCIQGPTHGLVNVNSCIQGPNHGLVNVNSCIQGANHGLASVNSCIQGPNHELFATNNCIQGQDNAIIVQSRSLLEHDNNLVTRSCDIERSNYEFVATGSDIRDTDNACIVSGDRFDTKLFVTGIAIQEPYHDQVTVGNSTQASDNKLIATNNDISGPGKELVDTYNYLSQSGCGLVVPGNKVQGLDNSRDSNTIRTSDNSLVISDGAIQEFNNLIATDDDIHGPGNMLIGTNHLMDVAKECHITRIAHHSTTHLEVRGSDYEDSSTQEDPSCHSGVKEAVIGGKKEHSNTENLDMGTRFQEDNYSYSRNASSGHLYNVDPERELWIAKVPVVRNVVIEVFWMNHCWVLVEDCEDYGADKDTLVKSKEPGTRIKWHKQEDYLPALEDLGVKGHEKASDKSNTEVNWVVADTDSDQPLTDPESESQESESQEPEKRGSSSLRRAASDAQTFSKYRTSTASIQLRRTPAEAEDSTSNRDTLKALHTARLQSALEFFRKKEEFNKANKGTALHRGRPGSLHASFTYGSHGNHNSSQPNQQNGTATKFDGLTHRSSEPNFYEKRHELSSVVNSGDSIKTMNKLESPGFGQLNMACGGVIQKNGICVNGLETGHVITDTTQRGEVETDSTGGLPTLEKLKKDIDALDEKLHESGDYDVRRGIRAQIRDLRKQIKEEKYCKPGESSSQSHGISNIQVETSSRLPQAPVTATVKITNTVTKITPQTAVIVNSSEVPDKQSSDNEDSDNVSNSMAARRINSFTTRKQHSLHSVAEKCEDETDQGVGIIPCPEIVRPLTDHTVIDGDPCTMQCRLSAPDGATVSWYHDDRILKPTADFKQTFRSNVAKLEFMEVFPDDVGVYKCVVTCDGGMAETAASLTVLGENDGEMPDISVPLEDQKASEGATITLCCHVCGKPQPTISWSRDGYSLLDTTRYIYCYDGTQALLTIHDSITGDGGTYTCEAKNAVGIASSECRVDVSASEQKRPEFLKVLPSSHRVTAGNSITLTCHVTGRPRPDVRWHHESTAYNLLECDKYSIHYKGDCAKLTLRETTRDMGGDYSCLASNTAGDMQCITTVSVTGSTPEPGIPEFSMPLSDVTTTKNTSVMLKCQIRGQPRPVVLWQKGKDFLRSGAKYKPSFEGETATLEIHSVDDTDTGSYNCMARNEFGKVKSGCVVNVRGSNGGASAREKMSGKADINAINDEDELYKMLNKTDDFDERKKIRSRMRDIREAKAAEFERQRKEREAGHEDAITMRIRLADEQKKKKMDEFEKQAKGGRKDSGTAEKAIREKHAAADAEKQRKLESYTEMGKTMSQVYNAGTDILRKAEEDQQTRLKELSEDGVSRSTKTEKNTDGGTTTTATTVTTHRTKDGATTSVRQSKQITQTSGLGGTSYAIKQTSADKIAKNLVDTFQMKGVPTTSGLIQVKTEAWSSKDGITKRQEKTQAWGNSASKPGGPRGARAAFQQMDKTTAPPAGTRPNFLGGGGGGGAGRAVQRSPSTIKQMLLDWCKSMTKEYEPTVTITNFSSCWNNGLAFCALIHHFYPDAFVFEDLDPKKRRYNFTLAFDTAENLADIAPLLDVEDMVRMKNPDWKCVFTYIQMFYRRFRTTNSTPTTPVTPISPEPVAQQ